MTEAREAVEPRVRKPDHLSVKFHELATGALDHVADGIIVLDDAWTLVFVNAPGARVVDRPVDELVGRSFWELFPESEHHELGDSYREAVRTRRPQHVETEYGPLGGWFDVRSTPVPGGLIITFQSSNASREAAATQEALVARLEESLARQNQTQSVVIAFAEAMSVQDVAIATRHLAHATLGTALAEIALLSPDDQSLRFVTGESADVPLSTASPLTDSYRLGQPRYDDADGGAFASVPLTVGRRTIGVLSLAWVSERTFSDEDWTYMRMLSGQCAQAVERTTLIARQRDVAETLQEAMLPDRLPASEGVVVSACYLPSTRDLTVGGDWYDAFTLPDGRLVFAIGDVSGHGVQAAAVMGQIRNALRAYIVEGHHPAGALTRLDRFVEHAGHGLFATAIVAAYTPSTGELVWANGGHPPLVRRSHGTSSFLVGHLGAPIGVVGPLGYRNNHSVLAVGEAVIGYTDGLVERRHEDMNVGLDRLLVAVDRAVAPAVGDAWCVDLVDDVLGAEVRGDDICVVVVQRR
jgi:serine phosphatase RsbU (regulator of sigma subunit)